MTAADSDRLRDIGDGPLLEAQSDAQMNGTYLRVDGNGIDVRYNVGVRNRGGASRVGPPNNYRINFPHDQTFNGAVSLNLNSRIVHAQILGSAIYRLAGMPAAEGIPMQVRINGVNLAESGGPDMFGSYVQMETINGSFPDRYFPEDRRGNLYRVIEVGTETGDLRFEGTDPAAYDGTYSKRTNEEDNDWSDLIDLVDVLNNASDASFIDEVNRVLDLDQWLRYLALDALLGNLETGLNSGRGDNYWLYRGTEDTRFKLIPHDLDTILGRGRTGQPNRSIFSYTDTPGLARLLTHEEVVPRYHQAFVDLIEEFYNPETLFPLFDHLVGHLPDFELDAMKQFVVDRIAGVEAQLPREFVVTSNLPVVDGFHRTTLPATELVGTASAVETRSVLVNGQAANWSPILREWSLTTAGQGTTTPLIALGSEWQYLDDGSNQVGWTSVGFNDARWNSGAAPLGYGEGDEATVVDFGANPTNKYITTYFRHTFSVDDPAQILDLSLRLERDDGAVVYLNGQEIVRSNLPDGPLDFQTVASSWIGGGLEGQLLSFSVDPALLQVGENVIAVEVHQLSAVDDDLRFDLELEATVGTVEGGVALHPGINRIVVEAFDGPDGSGSLVDSGFIDVWYDGAIAQSPSTCGALGELAPTVIPGGTLTEDTVLAPCGPVYRVTGDVVVPAGVTLTVLPGTTVFFEQDSGITVEGGQLIAEGDAFNQIRFTRAPDVAGSWNGIQFVNSTADNRIRHAVLEYATTDAGMVGLLSSSLVIEDSTFDHADLFRINTVNSSLVVRNSIFTDMFAPGAPPLTDNASEHIKGSGILAGGQLLLEGNYFGTTSGHNDAVDFDGAARPDPIPVILNNVFAGSGDDALDLEADAHIEGNAFRNVIKDQFNTSTGDANAISAGNGREYVVVRNTFYNVDHAVQVKDEAFLTFQHNTVVDVHISPIYFDLPDRSPGRGARVEDSIFIDTPLIFAAADQAQEVSVDRSIVTEDALLMGEDNSLDDPRLADPANGDFQLRPGSPALGTGNGGRDRGALVQSGLAISGEPPESTGQTTASLLVTGPGITTYRFRLNDAPFSDDIPIDQPIELQDLGDGVYQVQVIGTDSAGQLQLESDAVSSQSWTVDTTINHLRINEVLASNDSFTIGDATPDVIELYNDGPTSVDLGGMAITDDPTDPAKFVFSSGTSIESGGYLLLLATPDSNAGIPLGFRLDADGEGVYLYDTVENGRSLVDEVEFGIQVTDLSISRVGSTLEWQLSTPTLGAQNIGQTTGDPATLRINEWLGRGDIRFTGDFLELYNPDPLPVELSGLFLTDDPVARPARHQIAPLSFIAGQGFTTFDPNGNLENGANELPLGIRADGEILALLDSSLRPIDQVLVLSQTTDVSQGRAPDGSDQLLFQELATPGNPNPIETEVITLLSEFGSTWQFDQSGTDLGDAWRDVDFDAADWASGQGPFGVTTGGQVPAVPIETPLNTGVVTHYFRREIELDADLIQDQQTTFTLTTMVDDGAVVYLNDVEVLRLGIPDGPVDFETRANRGIGLASLEGPFDIPSELFIPGRNVLAVEVHQISPASGDVVFGAELTAVTTFSDELSAAAVSLLRGLRISEVMYNPSDAGAEFIEFTNITDTPIDLPGVQLRGGVEFTFSGTNLEPGERVVVARDADRFREVYGLLPRVVGEYAGRLSNGGEELVVALPAPFDGPFDGSIQTFTYSDDWHPLTDGEGFSLEIIDPGSADLSTWNRAEGWKVSSLLGGSPGGLSPDVTTDFNGDGIVDEFDLDLLSAAIDAPSVDLAFDLNGDQRLDFADLTILVENHLGTRPGDTNLDGTVDFADFLIFAANFGTTGASWSEGDFDADGSVGFTDFLLLSQWFGFGG